LLGDSAHAIVAAAAVVDAKRLKRGVKKAS
jgi:hypothetical protein